MNCHPESFFSSGNQRFRMKAIGGQRSAKGEYPKFDEPGPDGCPLKTPSGVKEI